MDHGGKESDTASLVQSCQRYGDEVKEGRDPQCDLDICHEESGFDHSLGHWSERRFCPGVQRRSKKEAGSDISRNSLEGV